MKVMLTSERQFSPGGAASVVIVFEAREGRAVRLSVRDGARDEQVQGFLRCVRRHLAPGGSCVITMFNPIHDPDTMRREWVRGGETEDWQAEVDGERIVATDRRPRMDPERLVLYPELVYRRYRGAELREEVVMPIVMRCWYPDRITALLGANGFVIADAWGGYGDERFGDGPELVLRFTDRTRRTNEIPIDGRASI